MPELYYTAVIKDGKVFTDADGFVYAEHFEDAAERDKRARQFAGALNGDGVRDVYVGTEPPEAWLARFEFRTYDAEGTETPDDYHKAIDAHAAKAGAKTASVLTAPEVDDSQEARALPDWAAASHAVDAARQVWVDAKAAAEAHKIKADKAAQEYLGPDADKAAELLPDMKKQDEGLTALHHSGAKIGVPGVPGGVAIPPPKVNSLRRKAIETAEELDRANGALYLAEQDLAAKIAAYEKIKPKEGKKNA